MPSRLYIPAQVLESIAAHIHSAIKATTEAFLSAAENEDAMTGHLGGALTAATRTVDVTQDEVNGPWKWSLQYRKLRSQGKGATESYLGADGIFELTLDRGYRQDTKSLLFQSKIDWRNAKDILAQSMRLSTWREAAIVINYTPDEFYAYSIDSALASKGEEAKARGKLPLAAALSEHFLACKIGDVDLHYDAQARRLLWRDAKGVWVAAQFSIPHRFQIHVSPPSSTAVRTRRFDKMLSPAEVHMHRMQASPDEILMPLLSDQQETVKVRKKTLSMTYHPDMYSGFDALTQALATKRMQEINEAVVKMARRERKDA